MKSLAPAAFAALLAACAASRSARQTPPATPSSPAPSSTPPANAAATMAPTPYTAEQIRAASSVGRTYTFRVEMSGRPTVLRTLTFVSVTPEGADVSAEVRDEHGAVLQAARTEHSTWDELRLHGEFPAAALTTREETVTVPAGTYPCVIYTVRNDDGTVSHFAFTRTMPGPPVQFDIERNGVREMTATLVTYRSGR